MKIPIWLHGIINTITDTLNIEPSRSVQAIIIAALMVAVVIALIWIISILRVVFSRNKQFSNDDAAARTRLVNAVLPPNTAEYERMINDAIETAMLPVLRRIKRLEEHTLPGEQPTVIAKPHNAEAAQLYDDVQDVVLPQEEDIAEQVSEDTGMHALPPEEENTEHTSIAQVSEDTGMYTPPTEEEDDKPVSA